MKKINPRSKTVRIIKSKKKEQELHEKKTISEVKPGLLLAVVSHNEEPVSPVNQYKARAIRLKGGRVMAQMYMDSKFDQYKNRFIESVKSQYQGPLYSCSIKVIAEFRFGTKRRKDLSNAGKLEYDALNGIIYEDDSQISEIQAKKIYSKEKPGCTISIYSAEPDVWGSYSEIPNNL